MWQLSGSVGRVHRPGDAARPQAGVKDLLQDAFEPGHHAHGASMGAR